jgi:hypothetical protein
MDIPWGEDSVEALSRHSVLLSLSLSLSLSQTHHTLPSDGDPAGRGRRRGAVPLLWNKYLHRPAAVHLKQLAPGDLMPDFTLSNADHGSQSLNAGTRPTTRADLPGRVFAAACVEPDARQGLPGCERQRSAMGASDIK